MDGIMLSGLYGCLAGFMIPAGALVARIEHFQEDWLEQEFRHSVMAFGAGALIAAVALVLVPEGVKGMPPLVAVIIFFVGGIGFAWIDRQLSGRTNSRAQLLAMLSDFLPEALALGAMVAAAEPGAGLLALLIGLQNLPEGFNAYRELNEGNRQRPNVILALFVMLACLGPIAAITGHVFLVNFSWLTSTLMLGASGGILFLMFQDIAPKIRLDGTDAPPLAGLAGFGFGLLGQLILA